MAKERPPTEGATPTEWVRQGLEEVERFGTNTGLALHAMVTEAECVPSGKDRSCELAIRWTLRDPATGNGLHRSRARARGGRRSRREGRDGPTLEKPTVPGDDRCDETIRPARSRTAPLRRPRPRAPERDEARPWRDGLRGGGRWHRERRRDLARRLGAHRGARRFGQTDIKVRTRTGTSVPARVVAMDGSVLAVVSWKVAGDGMEG